MVNRSPYSNPMAAVLQECGVKDYSSKYARDVKTDPNGTKARNELFQRADHLIKAYNWLMSTKDISLAKSLRWARRNVQEYDRAFLCNVLMDYRIWEMTAEEFRLRYEMIATHNPEWAVRFLQDASDKCSRSVKSVQSGIQKMLADVGAFGRKAS